MYREGSYRGRPLGPKAIQRRRAEEVETIKARAWREVVQLRHSELWGTGLRLYWAEGDKKEHVALSNSDPQMVRFMMKWFREICHVPEGKLKAYLNIHSGQNDRAVKMFWSKVTGLPLSQFGKSYVKKEGTGHRTNRLYDGTIKINICDKNLLHTIQGWIEGYAQLVCGPLA